MDDEDIAKVLANHQLHESMNLCLGCQWRPRAGRGSLRIQHRDHLAAVLAPLVEQAKREAWDEGYGSDLTCQEPRTNPYRAARPEEPGREGGGA